MRPHAFKRDPYQEWVKTGSVVMYDRNLQTENVYESRKGRVYAMVRFVRRLERACRAMKPMAQMKLGELGASEVLRLVYL